MAQQFKRQYDLTITPVRTNGEAETNLIRTIRDLRINFEATKDLTSVTNTCRVSLYNPNDDTLATLKKRFTRITLNAGYENDLGLIFQGEIRNVSQERQGVDRIVTIYASDGERAIKNGVINKTFSPKVTVLNVVKEIVNEFGLTVKAIQDVPNIADKLQGQTLSGQASKVLDKISKEYGFSWSVQDEAVIITGDTVALEGDVAVVVSAATGMIGTPTTTIEGANVTTLLNYRLLPNRAMQIESVNQQLALGDLFFTDAPRTDATGLYKIQRVVFKGDNRDGDWLADVTGITLTGQTQDTLASG